MAAGHHQRQARARWFHHHPAGGPPVLLSSSTATRKLAEILLARKIESELSKDEIFELYLNKSFFGNRAYGVAAAAEFYYGKKLNELDLDEMASLAGIPKFPLSGNPISNPERARQRRDNYVLQRMADLKFVSQAEADAAKACRCTPPRMSRRCRSTRPTWPNWCARMIARFGGDVSTRATTSPPPSTPPCRPPPTWPSVMACCSTTTATAGTAWRSRCRWAGEDAAALAEHLRGLYGQAGLLPAIVAAPVPMARHRGAGQPQRDRAAGRCRQVDQQDPGQAGAAR